MWHEKKREEESTRREWVMEHRKMLDIEIKKYADAKRSDKVHQAYKSWIDKKKLTSPKLPSHSESRARPLACFKEEVIHDFHRRQLSKKVQEKVGTPRPRQYSPRLQLERVRKIQELRNTITSRDVTSPPHDVTRPSREMTSNTAKQRDVARQHRSKTSRSDNSKQLDTSHASKNTQKTAQPPAVSSPEELKPGIKYSLKQNEAYYHQYRISKLAEPKQPCNRKKRRRKKTPNTPPEEAVYYPVRIDNYFSPTSSTPDSGYVEDSPTSPSPDTVNNLKVDELNKLEIVSVHSEESHSVEKSVEETTVVQGKSDISASKTVRFSENISYDTEHDSVSFGNSLEHLRSCIKVKNLQKY